MLIISNNTQLIILRQSFKRSNITTHNQTIFSKLNHNYYFKSNLIKGKS